MGTNKIILRVLTVLLFAATPLSVVGQSSSEIDKLCQSVFKEYAGITILTITSH